MTTFKVTKRSKGRKINMVVMPQMNSGGGGEASLLAHVAASYDPRAMPTDWSTMETIASQNVARVAEWLNEDIDATSSGASIPGQHVVMLQGLTWESWDALYRWGQAPAITDWLPPRLGRADFY